MTSRVQRIEIRNFKAFRKFDLDVEGRHLLIYGPNGSGKSSLFWAIYTFLQSARKPKNSIAKYFDPAAPERLLNIYEDDASNLGEISLTLRDAAINEDITYRISRTDHETHGKPAILKGELASDFITYRFFFGFSHFRNSETFNIWPLFEKEILPFCVSTGSQNPLEMWHCIRDGDPNPSASRGLGGAYSYDEFRRRTEAFATILPSIVDAISDEAQRFYDVNFSPGDPGKVTLKLGVTTPPSFSGTNQLNSEFKIPVVEFGIQIDGKTIDRPQAFLNEAKLTQLALSVRFAASLVNLHESDLKLLVLDDLLVSLDMSNRMRVVEILLSESFANYQKIVLTHDLGFFREFRRKVGANHADWCFLRLEGTPDVNIMSKSEKTDIQKAEDYLHGHDLDEAALCLRKAAEDMAKRWREWMEKRSIPPGEFHSLTDHLRAAKNHLMAELPMKILGEIIERTPEALRPLLIPTSDDDIEQNPELDVQAKGILKSKRKRLRNAFDTEHIERLRVLKLIDDVLACTERVLNPAAHAGDPPLYEIEVEHTLTLIKQLDSELVGKTRPKP